MKRLNKKRRWIATPTSSARNDGQEKKKGFTLVELVIVIAIVIILSVVSVPIYQGYSKKAKWSEAYALLGVILSAQKAYYSEYGNFLNFNQGNAGSEHFTFKEDVFGIDARGNKYFTLFKDGGTLNGDMNDMKYLFIARVEIPKELRTSTNGSYLKLHYDITTGSTFSIVQSSSGA